jgi:hypothetical protein
MHPVRAVHANRSVATNRQMRICIRITLGSGKITTPSASVMENVVAGSWIFSKLIWPGDWNESDGSLPQILVYGAGGHLQPRFDVDAISQEVRALPA